MPPLGRRQARHSKHGVVVCGFFRHWLTYIPVRNNLATLHPKNIHVGSATVFGVGGVVYTMVVYGSPPHQRHIACRASSFASAIELACAAHWAFNVPARLRHEMQLPQHMSVVKPVTDAALECGVKLTEKISRSAVHHPQRQARWAPDA